MEGQILEYLLKKMGSNTRNWVDSAQDRDYRECGIDPLGSISHEVKRVSQ
jgi:hypothetical protein